MDSIRVRPAVSEDLPSIAALIARLNVLPEHQCLHCGEDAEEVRNTMLEWGAHPEASFVVAEENGALVGVLGAETGEGNAWLWGPFVNAENWDATAEALFDLLFDRLPPSVAKLHTFTGAANTRTLGLLRRLDVQETSVAHIYTATAASVDLSYRPRCAEFQPDHFAAFRKLHQLAFPGAPDTPEEIVAQLDDDHKLFVVTGDDGLQGFLYATINTAPVEGFVEVLAVQPQSRGRGIGRDLLQCALVWMFETKQMPQAGLVVRDERGNARRLYERAGFSLSYTGISGERALPV